ncbi:MAG: substrate-binding periplasmic protein [Thalassospira sp.]|uniref:substrate-binding periplasmic protein n=1 Tax=Thalassospira sp. TaxID=1912094 RepID=UPI003A895EAF
MKATAACRFAPLISRLAGLATGVTLIFATAVTFVTTGRAMPDRVDLVTLDWAPYTGLDLSGHGQTSQVITAAFNAVDIHYTINVIPWKRALQGILHDHTYDAIYPLYRTPQRLEHFLLSDPVGTSPLGFVHLQSTKLTWDHYVDLKEYVIGYVIGYTYKSRLRKMLESNQLKAVSAHDDETLLRQLIAGHIEIVLMDHNVAQHLVTTHPEFSNVADLLIYNPHLVIEQSLHVGFPKTEQGRHLLEQFNLGLRINDCSNRDCGSETVPEPLPLAEAINGQ